jgi:cytidine deaminase
VNKTDLINAAKESRRNAYAPYSKFLVGAALQTRSGRIYCGANIENVSLGLTLCAERVCIGAAITAGDTSFEVIAVVADSDVPVVPCGACRQVLAEFSPAVEIVSSTLTGEVAEFRLEELLPRPKQGIS